MWRKPKKLDFFHLSSLVLSRGIKGRRKPCGNNVSKINIYIDFIYNPDNLTRGKRERGKLTSQSLSLQERKVKLSWSQTCLSRVLLSCNSIWSMTDQTSLFLWCLNRQRQLHLKGLIKLNASSLIWSKLEVFLTSFLWETGMKWQEILFFRSFVEEEIFYGL